MDFFSFWRRGKTPSQVEQRPVQQQAGRQSAGRGDSRGARPAAPQAPQRTAQPQKSAVERAMATPPAAANRPVRTQQQSLGPSVLTRKDEIPPHASVLSSAGGAVELSLELQKNYAILLVSTESKEVIIVCSTEVGKNKPDNYKDDDYLAISGRIHRQGYHRKKVLADPEILAIIYESGSSAKTSEEQLRAATKIQLDFDELLRAAVEADASDIHIEVRRDEARVRFRKHGSLYQFKPWPVRYARTMASVIYTVIAAEKDTMFDDAKPQDAIIDRELSEDLRLRVRLATIPAYPAGFDMIMRLLKMGQDGKRVSLDKLGYEKRQLSHIRRAVAKPAGAVIMAGTTGSGKSTSLNSMLGEKIEIYGGRIKVITVEDPPEYMLHGATQIPIVRSRSVAKAGDATVNPFASVVRAAMRSDPDILMVGEVRDHSSAELLIHAVESGHQVFTTVHAGSGINIVPRLRSNGIPDEVLGGQGFISALIYQTLLQTVCPHCAHGVEDLKLQVKNDQDEEFIERLYRYIPTSLLQSLRFTNYDGCSKCSLGVTGRSVASEVILPDAHMLKCFRDRREAEALMHYRHRGGKIALEHGILKALRGQADLRDVELKLDQITYLDELDQSVRAEYKLDQTHVYMIGSDIFDEIDPKAKKIITPSTDIVDASGSPLRAVSEEVAPEAVKSALTLMKGPEGVGEANLDRFEQPPEEVETLAQDTDQVLPSDLAVDLIHVMQRALFQHHPALSEKDVAERISSKLAKDLLAKSDRDGSFDADSWARIKSIYSALTDQERSVLRGLAPEYLVTYLQPVDHSFVTEAASPNPEASKRYAQLKSSEGHKPAAVRKISEARQGKGNKPQHVHAGRGKPEKDNDNNDTEA